MTFGPEDEHRERIERSPEMNTISALETVLAPVKGQRRQWYSSYFIGSLSTNAKGLDALNANNGLHLIASLSMTRNVAIVPTRESIFLHASLFIFPSV